MIHITVGTLLFIVIYAPAVGLQLLVGWLASLEISYLLILVVQVAEYILVGADTALFVVFLLKTTWRTMRAL